MVARVLETAGYTATLSGVGPETLSAIRDLKPDLLLLDVNSPGSEGWDVLNQVRHAASELPVILITGWPNLGPEAVQRGIQWLMEKPLDLPELLALIQRLLLEPARSERDQGSDTKVKPVFEGGLALASVPS
jgi:DNA-binding response OmpR family regulator